MGWYIIVGSLPIVVLGIALKDVIEKDFRNLWIVGTTLIVLGVVLGIADRIGSSDRVIKKMTPKHPGPLGLAQACAPIPGATSSGATIPLGRVLAHTPKTATPLAFHLALPPFAGHGT